jgi:hypothetical protein
MKNQKFNNFRIKKICESKLDIDFKKGAKELSGWFKKDDKKVNRITIPKGRENPKRGTYKSMATQLDLKVSEFDELLECPLDRKGYEKILKDRPN